MLFEQSWLNTAYQPQHHQEGKDLRRLKPNARKLKASIVIDDPATLFTVVYERALESVLKKLNVALNRFFRHLKLLHKDSHRYDYLPANKPDNLAQALNADLANALLARRRLSRRDWRG